MFYGKFSRSNIEWKNSRKQKLERFNELHGIKKDKIKALLNSRSNDDEIRHLCADVLTGKIEKRKSSFVFILKDEMENLLFPSKFELVILDNVKEYVYDRAFKNIPNIAIRIYSSIDPMDFSRNKGKDAIRISLVDKKTNKRIGLLSKTIYRMEGWQDRLKKAVNEFYLSANDLHLCNCGCYLTERKVKTGARKRQKFFGCSNFPECRFTL